MTRLRTVAATVLALALMTGAGATAFGQSTQGEQRPQ